MVAQFAPESLRIFNSGRASANKNILGETAYTKKKLPTK